MRVNVDSAALTDPRIRKLGRSLGMAWQEALGRLISVWMLASDRRATVLPDDDIDIVAERDGFANAMRAASLADGAGRNGSRIRGTTERIRFLQEQAERASQRWTKARAKASANAHANASANAYANSPDLDQDQDQDQSPDQDQDPLPPRAKARSRSSDWRSGYEPAELEVCDRVLEKLSGRARVSYQLGKAAAKLICARLREGYTERDLRWVIGYCADATGKGWEDNDRMREYLRPSTLFGPENFEQYIAQARAWHAKQWPNGEPSNGAQS